MYGVLILRSKAKVSHSNEAQLGVSYTGLPGSSGPRITAEIIWLDAGPTGLYAGPGEKKVGYGRCPSTISCENASKKTPNPARSTVLPLPVTSQAALTRGAKSFLSGL